MLPGVAPGIPFVAAGNPAFMAPNKGFAVNELVDVELQCLRGSVVTEIKPDVVSEVMQRGDKSASGIREALRGEISNQVIVPKDVGISFIPANRCFGRLSIRGGIGHTGGPRPGRIRSAGLAAGTDTVGRREQSIACPARGVSLKRIKRTSTTATGRWVASANSDCDWSFCCSSAVIPLLNHGVVSAGAQI